MDVRYLQKWTKTYIRELCPCLGCPFCFATLLDMFKLFGLAVSVPKAPSSLCYPWGSFQGTAFRVESSALNLGSGSRFRGLGFVVVWV